MRSEEDTNPEKPVFVEVHYVKFLLEFTRDLTCATRIIAAFSRCRRSSSSSGTKMALRAAAAGHLRGLAGWSQGPARVGGVETARGPLDASHGESGGRSQAVWVYSPY